MCKSYLLGLSVLLSISIQAYAENQVPLIDGRINFKVEALSRCNLGDLNLIAAEVNREPGERRRIIATIEAIPGSEASFVAGNSGQILTLNQADFKTLLKPEFQIAIKGAKSAQIAALYLCKDGDNLGSCNKKEIENFDQMIAEHEIKPESIDLASGKISEKVTAIKKAQKDKIYFFNPVILSEGGINILQGKSTEEDIKAELLKYDVKDKAVIDYVLKTLKAVGSLRLKTEDKSVVIELPFNDPEKCYQKSE